MKVIKRLIEQVLSYFGVWKPIYVKYENIKGLRVVQGPFNYSQDQLHTRHNADFMNEPDFANAMKAASHLADKHRKFETHWRNYVNCWAARHGTHLEGDFVECGVLRGFMAMTVLKYARLIDTDKRYYLVDTYSGVDVSLASDDEKARNIGTGLYADMSDWSEEVEQTFSAFENVIIVKGSVPEVLPKVKSEKISYLHIDMNNAVPEIAAAEYFWEKLVSGAVVVLDDYGFTKHIEQKQAFDYFAQRKGITIMALPTGQGMYIKP